MCGLPECRCLLYPDLFIKSLDIYFFRSCALYMLCNFNMTYTFNLLSTDTFVYAAAASA